MPKTIETKVFEFDELNDAAKEKAREWFREGNLDYDWWEFIYQDAIRMGALMGIEIAEKDISFSGFWSQGDGASFEGSYSFKQDAAKAVSEECNGSDAELIRIATALDKLQEGYANRVQANISRMSHHYSHSGTMQVDSCFLNAEDEDESLADDSDKDLTRLMRDFADWIYSQLEKEYEYQNSDEVVDDNIRANEYTFTETGKRFG